MPACAPPSARCSINVRGVFDMIFIDCPPGLSVLTESWLREADFHFSPTKPDYVSTCGLEVFRRFKGLNPEMGFAENLGVIINMKDAPLLGGRRLPPLAHQQPRQQAASPRPCHAQARCSTRRSSAPVERSFMAKYPGESSVAIRAVCQELLNRLEAANAKEAAASPPATPVPPVGSEASS